MANLHEKPQTNHEQQADIPNLKEIREKRQDAIERSHENATRDTEREQKSAREAVERATTVKKELISPAERNERSRSPLDRRIAGKRERRQSFDATMEVTRLHMSPASRTFSKFIHHPTVEKTSDVIGSTVARPNAIASGAIAAFVFTLIIYLIANNYGYVLSGSETIAAFIAGWLVGQLYDFLKIMVTGRR